MTDDDELARSHMREQVKSAAAASTLAAELFRRYVDPDDFGPSFDRAKVGIAALIRQGRARAATLADGYYREELLAAGLDPADLPRWADELPPEAILAALDGGTRRNVHERELAAITARASDRSRADVLDTALGGLLGVVKARTAAGGTDRLAAIVQADRRVNGWARVSDGSPCHRCALLVSRGPVYRSERSAGFARHDGCGCSARLVVGDADPWSSEARHYRDLWDAAPDESTFRAELTHLAPRFDPLKGASLDRFNPAL